MANESEKIAPDMSKVKLLDLEAKPVTAAPQEQGYCVWWLKNVQKQPDGYKVDYDNLCLNPGNHNWIAVFNGTNRKAWEWAPGRTGTVKINTSPEHGDRLVYYVQGGALETGWPVYGLHP